MIRPPTSKVTIPEKLCGINQIQMDWLRLPTSSGSSKVVSLMITSIPSTPMTSLMITSIPSRPMTREIITCC